MTVDPNRVECDYCGTDTRGSRSHEHFDAYSDGRVRHLVTSLCCGCECARERAELARIDRARKAETESLKRQALRDLDAVVEHRAEHEVEHRAEHEAGVEAIADRIERRMGGVA